MESQSDSDEELLVLAVSVSAAIVYSKQQKSRSHFRQCYVQPINSTRPEESFYHQVMSRRENSEMESSISRWDMDEMENSIFEEHFRMGKNTFQELLSKVQSRLIHAQNHRFPISAAERLAVTLKLLASGDSVKTVACFFRMGQSTVFQVFYETCRVLWEVLQPQVLTVPTEGDWMKISAGFWEKCDFPLCLGAIDGKHIELQAPKNSGSAYFNYKKTHSIVLMAIADSTYRFVFVDVGAYGRQGDAGVFAQSTFGRALADHTNPMRIPCNGTLPETAEPFPFVFIGDAAFPIGPHLMRPYTGSVLSIKKRIFNYRLSRARRCIEQAFGIMANRFRIFRKPIHAEPDHAVLITKAAVVLHNFLSIREEAHPPSEADQAHRLGLSVEAPRQGNRVSNGTYLRDKLSEWFSSEIGCARVPWQEDHARRGE